MPLGKNSAELVMTGGRAPSESLLIRVRCLPAPLEKQGPRSQGLFTEDFGGEIQTWLFSDSLQGTASLPEEAWNKILSPEAI